ncbi:winged helix-turn-helix transcriptional regulator [Natronorubrum bangense]|uniref:HxlR family transcriptional regulator n=2 Tax=Natronorubrum bangense TaxID=61858 RepID=L9W9E4_9EURY|nr:helix-turn-helix domain-containing protein [Natronorubrum bangense]ELY45901.1 HxlR family transcriptional regulator [Natronorubrum bangense JCM 10635]QCC56641.1 transcriptional regulator [Natronorubrum bangense]
MPTAKERSQELVEGNNQLVTASNVLGRKWHSTIVYQLLDAGLQGFGDLKARIGGISRKVLSESLTNLGEQGIVEQLVLETKPVRVEYSLTSAGRELQGRRFPRSRRQTTAAPNR